MNRPLIDREIFALLRVEATEYIDAINQALLALEGDGEATEARFAEIMRVAHSLKGTAAAAGLGRVERMMHNWESCALSVVEGKVELTPLHFDLLYRSLDAVQAEIEGSCTGVVPALRAPAPSARELSAAFSASIDPVASLAPIAGQPGRDQANDNDAEPDARDRAASLRIATHKIDSLMTKVEDLVQVQAGAPGSLERSRRLVDTVAHSVRAFEECARAGTLRTRARGHDDMRELRRRLDELTRHAEELHIELSRHHARLDSAASALRDDVRSVRMVPVRAALSALPRLARDAAAKLGKQVTLDFTGADTEIDRDLIERVKDALMHLVRNAVAHGIESPEERIRRGKSPSGHVQVVASSGASGLQISVSDDGAGIAHERVLERAVRTGIVTADEARGLSRERCEELIFSAGLTTSTSVDELSGRGVGLDAVRSSLEAAGGSVSVRSESERGTHFLLRLPLNLTSMRLLLVRVGQTRLAVPSVAISKIVRVRHDDVRTSDGGQAIEVEGHVLPIAHLAELLALDARTESAERLPALLLASGDERAAVLVDAVEGELELIIKGLGAHLGRVAAIASATVLPDGQILPVVRGSELVRRARTGSARSSVLASSDTKSAREKRILVVDDSITTRTLEKSILEASGYVVEIATDGLDAVSKLIAQRFDLVLSDVQMPRMGGIELVRRIKSDTTMRATPVVLVSSLSDPEDKKLGLEAGASAYLSKNEFRQDLLLETLEQFL